MNIKPMFSVLLSLILALILTDCAAQSVLDNEVNSDEVMKPGDPQPGEWIENRKPNNLSVCPDDPEQKKIRGSSVVLVTYGDSSLHATPVTKVKRKNDRGVGAIEFILIPTGISEVATVTIKGTRGPTGASLSWLDKTGKVSPQDKSRVSIVACVDDDTLPGEYKYEVRVQDVGTLDPRADVED